MKSTAISDSRKPQKFGLNPRIISNFSDFFNANSLANPHKIRYFDKGYLIGALFEPGENGIPVYSLYGEHREPTAEMLSHVDAMLVDLQDVGARYYTFIWTLYLCMKACEKQGIPVVVVDRPNPINCVDEEGPVLDLNYTSFVGLHSIRTRHAKTIIL